MKDKLILITNDDGVNAKGISELVGIARKYGKVVVVAPDEYTGGVIGDITSRRGKPLGQESRGNALAFTAMVPLAEMFGYATVLRSSTQGRASYSMEPDHFAEVPKSVQDKVIADRGRNNG